MWTLQQTQPRKINFSQMKEEGKINRERTVIFNLKPEELGFDLRVYAFLFSFTCCMALLLGELYTRLYRDH